MAEDDIYNSKRKYEDFKKELELFLIPPEQRTDKGGRGKYYCKNESNLQYFRNLFDIFETDDISYIRRLRLLNTFRLITYLTDKDLGVMNEEDDRDESNSIIRKMHPIYNSVKSKKDFIRDFKRMSKLLFPVKDNKGRIDDDAFPYFVSHIKYKDDKSKEKRRDDKLTYEEYEKILHYFSKEPEIQFFISLIPECLGRPQEVLYTKLKDVEKNDEFAKIWISEHGKEGTGFLQVIDSYPYLIKWLEKHPFKDDSNSYLFVNMGNKNFGEQLKPHNINKRLRTALKRLGINKPITCYSLKRNGVTFKRLRGYSDAEIQHTARWTSTKQLQTYDLSNQDDIFKKELIKRGLIEGDSETRTSSTIRCAFCNTLCSRNDEFCSTCQRLLDRKKLSDRIKKHQEAQGQLDKFFDTPQMKELFKLFVRLTKEQQIEHNL